ncbi:BQ2448_6785 [Microbotryum intermedium]|uniref:BQ2448_6785 protein n=1 Tax=Microbotryum intermedium TaxID=269621 RepID=A0A238FQS7_9BASI|nr:BQ2448_6785 [Microbotryum intermedium]
MARGLFRVYQDAPAPPPAASTSAIPSSSASSAAKAIAQRKRVHRDSSSLTLSKTGHPPSKSSFLVRHDENAPAVVHRRPGKENVDPHAVKSRLGAGKKLALLESEPTTGTATSSSKSSIKVFQDAPKGTKALPKPSVNGECTGTLRTRVIPGFSSTDDEQDPSTPPVVRKSSAALRSKHSAAGNHRPVRLDDALAEHSPAHDSGYAPSPTSASDVDSGSKHSFDLSNADRRARALTESPLAEVTEAFTGLGRFTNRNFADRPASPSPLSTSSGNSRPIRSRRSPIKKGAQATKPYDVATSNDPLPMARRTKSRFESNGPDELSRGIRSMRV